MTNSPASAGRIGRFVRRRLGRADGMGRDEQREAQNPPRPALAEGEQKETGGGGEGRAQPPDLPAQEIRRRRAGQFRRQTRGSAAARRRRSRPRPTSGRAGHRSDRRAPTSRRAASATPPCRPRGPPASCRASAPDRPPAPRRPRRADGHSAPRRDRAVRPACFMRARCPGLLEDLGVQDQGVGGDELQARQRRDTRRCRRQRR